MSVARGIMGMNNHGDESPLTIRKRNFDDSGIKLDKKKKDSVSPLSADLSWIKGKGGSGRVTEGRERKGWKRKGGERKGMKGRGEGKRYSGAILLRRV